MLLLENSAQLDEDCPLTKVEEVCELSKPIQSRVCDSRPARERRSWQCATNLFQVSLNLVLEELASRQIGFRRNPESFSVPGSRTARNKLVEATRSDDRGYICT